MRDLVEKALQQTVILQANKFIVISNFYNAMGSCGKGVNLKSILEEIKEELISRN